MTEPATEMNPAGNPLLAFPRWVWGLLVTRPLRALDRGDVFQAFTATILRISALLTFVFGPVWLVYYLARDGGWLDQLQGADRLYSVRSIAALPFSGFVALATIVVIGGILWLRARDLREEPYRGLVGIFLRLVKLTGEVYSVFPVSTALTMFFSTILAAYPYAPLSPGMGAMGDMLSDLTKVLAPLMSALPSGPAAAGAQGITVELYLTSLVAATAGLVFSVVAAFVILGFFYLIAEALGILYYFLLRKSMFDEPSG